MSFGSKLTGAARRCSDWLVEFLSGSKPAPGLEGPKAFRVPLILGVIALILGGWIIWRTINPPVTPIAVANINGTTPVEELERLKSVDTDSDGLSDYTELFQTKTSPYLKDSDSDGVPDNQELDQNTDPNCPAGQSCSPIAGGTTTTENGLPPAFLRQALKASGVPQTTLDALSDDDIATLYDQVLAEAETGNANTDSATDINSLQQLSASDIRELLVSAGVDSSTLSSVDDATLKQIFEEALSSESQ